MRFFLTLLSIAVFFTNCTKDDTTTLENANIQNIEYGLPDFRVDNGIIYFKSISDAQKAYEAIDKKFNESTDPNIMKLIESDLGHSSLLFAPSNIISSLRDGEEEYTKEEIIAKEAGDFIGDDIRKLLLNSDYEIGVGNDVYVFFDKDKEYIIKDSHASTIEDFRTKEKGKNEIPHDIMNSHVELETTEVIHSVVEYEIEREDGSDDGTDENTADERTITITNRLSVNITSVECTLFTKSVSASVNQIVRDDNNTPLDPLDDIETRTNLISSFSFNMGDGSSILNFPASFGVNFVHVYPNPGTFTVSCLATPTGEFPMSFLTAVDVVSTLCSNEEIGNFDWQDDGSQALLTAIRFKEDFFGSHAGAGSAGFRKLSNGNWTKDYNGQIEASIDAVFLNNNCINPESKSEFESCNSCYQKKTWVSKVFGSRSIENGDIQSTHSASFGNGSTFTKSLVLNPC